MEKLAPDRLAAVEAKVDRLAEHMNGSLPPEPIRSDWPEPGVLVEIKLNNGKSETAIWIDDLGKFHEVLMVADPARHFRGRWWKSEVSAWKYVFNKQGW